MNNSSLLCIIAYTIGEKVKIVKAYVKIGSGTRKENARIFWSQVSENKANDKETHINVRKEVAGYGTMHNATKQCRTYTSKAGNFPRHSSKDYLKTKEFNRYVNWGNNLPQTGGHANGYWKF